MKHILVSAGESEGKAGWRWKEAGILHHPNPVGPPGIPPVSPMASPPLYVNDNDYVKTGVKKLETMQGQWHPHPLSSYIGDQWLLTLQAFIAL